MSLSAADLIQYVNYAAIGVIGLGALWGFIQGFYKSTFFFIWTVGILVGAFLVMPYVTAFVMGYDLSFVQQFFTLSGVSITNINETVPSYLITLVPDMHLENVLVPGSDALAVVLGAAQLVLNIVFLVLVFVLNLTLFRFIGWIIWRIIKPKKRDANGRRRKKGFLSRLLGAGVGALRGAFVLFLIAIPFAALVSLSPALDLASLVADQSEPQYQLMVLNDQVVLVQVAQPTATTQELMDQVKLFLDDYRTTYMGQIAGYVDINGVKLDEYVFDEIFNLTVQSDDLDAQIKFRDELSKALEVVNILVTANGGSTSFDDTFIYALDPTTVTQVFDIIGTLDIINVVVPVGIEYVVNSGEFDSQLAGYTDLFDLTALKEIDYLHDLGVLGDVFVDGLTLIQDQGTTIDQLNYFTFDGTTVTSILDSLSQLEMIDYALPVGLNYLVQQQGFIDLLAEVSLTTDDIVYPDVADLKLDFLNIATLYTAMQALGFQSTDDFNNLSDPAFLASVSDQAIADLITGIFNFSIVENNTTVASAVIYNYLVTSLPPEYQSLIAQSDITDNFNATEITNLVLLGKVVMSTGLLDALNAANPDYATILSDENIDAIVERISASNLIASKMNDVIAQLLGSIEALPFTLTIPDGIDWAAQSGQDELRAVLVGARVLLGSDLINGDFSTLDDPTINELAAALSNSMIFTYNLSGIFEQVISGVSGFTYTLALPTDPAEWTETEIGSLLKAAVILMDAGSDPNALLNLTSDQIHTMALSKIISNSFEGIFTDMVAVGGDLEGMLYIPSGLTWYSTASTTGELEHLLIALQAVIPSGTDMANFSFDLNQVLDAEIDTLLASKVLEMTIVETITPMIETGSLSNYIATELPNGDPYAWYVGEDNTYPQGDLKPLLEAVKGLNDLGIDFTSLSYTSITNSLTVEANKQTLNDLLLSSRVLAGSLDKLFTFVLTSSGMTLSLDNSADPTFWGTPTQDGELIRLLDAVSILGSTTLDQSSINATLLGDLLATNSLIVRDQISKVIIDSGLDIPAAAMDSPTQIKLSELQAVVTALGYFNSFNDISNMNPSTIDSALLTNLIAANSLIVNRQISSVIINDAGLDIPDGAFVDSNTQLDITTAELNALVTVLSYFGSFNDISALNPADINATLLNNLLSADSLIVNRKISSIIINDSGLDIPDGAYVDAITQKDIKPVELDALVAALAYFPSFNDIANLNANSITGTLLSNLVAANSLIVNRQISAAIIGSTLTIPSDALSSPTDVTPVELTNLSTALTVLGGSVGSVSSLSANDITGAKLTSLLNANSVIVNHQVSSAIISSGVLGSNTDAIDNTVGPRNGEVKNIEMVGLAQALTAFGPTATVSTISGISLSTIAALSDTEIDTIFDENYTIIYYKMEAQARANALYLMTLTPLDYEGGNTANRILRTSLARDLKSGALL